MCRHKYQFPLWTSSSWVISSMTDHWRDKVTFIWPHWDGNLRKPTRRMVHLGFFPGWWNVQISTINKLSSSLKPSHCKMWIIYDEMCKLSLPSHRHLLSRHKICTSESHTHCLCIPECVCVPTVLSGVKRCASALSACDGEGKNSDTTTCFCSLAWTRHRCSRGVDRGRALAPRLDVLSRNFDVFVQVFNRKLSLN